MSAAFSPSQHGLPMIGAVPPSKEVQHAGNQDSNGLQTLDLDALICEALRHAGLTHGQACAHMANDKGKAYDQSQWTKARATGDLPLGRMLGLPPVFWRHFIVGLAEAAEMHVSHAEMADIAVMKAATAFEAVADAFRHMQRRRA